MNRRTKALFQDGTSTNYTYDGGNRITQVEEKDAGNAVTATITRTYDGLDRLTQEVTAQGTVNYTYDNASRRATTVVGQPQVIYTYDNANRLTTGGTFARTNLPPALTTTNYNANNQQVTFETTTETFTWNTRNQLPGISRTGLTASFTYDSFGRRTGKAINGTTTNFVYDGLNPVQGMNGATVTANL